MLAPVFEGVGISQPTGEAVIFAERHVLIAAIIINVRHLILLFYGAVFRGGLGIDSRIRHPPS